MNTTDVQKIKTTLQDGVSLNVFDDYIGQFINESKDYYEKNLLEAFKDYIPSEAVIYDLGSNIGNHSIYFSKNTEAKNIYAFEPSKATFEVLEENIRNNKATNVTAFNLGVGNQNTKAKLVFNKANIGASYLTVDNSGDIDVVTLDTMNLPGPNFLKIDVEGFEYQVLQGAKKLLKHNTPVIWIEIFEQHFIEVDRVLEDMGYIQVDRWFDNYIYVHPNSQEEALDYMHKFKIRTLKRFDQHIRSINQKYKNSTKRTNEINEMLQLAQMQQAEFIRRSSEQNLNFGEFKELEYKLAVEKIEYEHLKEISQLESKITKLETEQKIARALAGTEDIISSLITLQKKLTKLEDENTKAMELIEKSNEQRDILKSELDSLQKVQNMKIEEHTKELNATITGLKSELLSKVELKDKNHLLTAHNESLSSELTVIKNKNEHLTKELEETNKKMNSNSTELLSKLNDKEDEIAKLKLDNQELRNNLKTSLDSEEKALKHMVSKVEELNATQNALSKSERELSKLERKYTSLTNSRLGKLTLRYWKLRKKIRK